LLWSKIDYIRQESGRDDVYIKAFIKRHPDIVLKSYASLDAKINYIARNMNRNLRQEKSFPLILNYNYNQVIRPRGDLLMEKLGVRPFDLHLAFAYDDEKFCSYWGIDIKKLQAAKKKRAARGAEEKDVMWQYVDSA
jgi:hypothetical protein